MGAGAQETPAQQAIAFDEAQIFFEENATDGDLGIQFFLDGEAWSQVMILRPDGEIVLDIGVKGNAGRIGLTELFSESSEPPFTTLPRAEFLARFPAGQYSFLGKTVDGKSLAGTATLTHNIPAAPKIVAPAKDAVVDASQPLVIRWDPVPNPAGSTIEAYQVIVEKDEDEERPRTLVIDMAKTDTTLTLAPGFLDPGKDYKVEVLAIEKGGNKTITEVGFETKE
jgi:hypothetical protein